MQAFPRHSDTYFTGSTHILTENWICGLTFGVDFAIFRSVIVLRKLAKPVTGGEPAGLSLFYLQEIFHGIYKTIFNVHPTCGLSAWYLVFTLLRECTWLLRFQFFYHQSFNSDYVRLRWSKANTSMQKCDYLTRCLFQFQYQFRVCYPYSLSAFYILTVNIPGSGREHILKEKCRFPVKNFDDFNCVCRFMLFFFLLYQTFKLFYLWTARH